MRVVAVGGVGKGNGARFVAGFEEVDGFAEYATEVCAADLVDEEEVAVGGGLCCLVCAQEIAGPFFEGEALLGGRGKQTNNKIFVGSGGVKLDGGARADAFCEPQGHACFPGAWRAF